MKKFFNLFLSFLAFFLLVPAFLILISWNALPGNQMYPVKLKLERVAVKLTGETALARQLEVKYTERRFSEADKLLAKEHSTIGFALLTAQANTAKEKVIQAQDIETKEILVTNLIEFNQALEEKKEEIRTQASTPPISKTAKEPLLPTPAPALILSPTPTAPTAEMPFYQPPTPTPTLKIATPTPTPIPTPVPQEPEEIIEDIEETQEEIEEIIEELEEEVSVSSEPSERMQQIMEERQGKIEEIRGKGRRRKD